MKAAIAFLLALLSLPFPLCPALAKESGDQWRDEGVLAKAPQDQYVGSAACARCHQEQFEHWSMTRKARFVLRASDLNTIPGKWKKAPFERSRVAWVIGLYRKHAYVDEDWKVLGAEYRLDKQKWKKKPKWEGSDYRVRCGPCHLTALDKESLDFVEPGVACEACHGPGALHAKTKDHMDIHLPGADLGPDSECRRCHNQRNNHAEALIDFTFPYHR